MASIDNNDPLGHRILELAKQLPGGVTNDDLNKHFPDMKAEKLIIAVNKLINSGLFELLKKGNKLYYRLKDHTKATVVPKDCDNEEKVVYSIIAESQRKGIWIRDIRDKLNLPKSQLNKILKNLESKQLIKSVKAVDACKRKCYMLKNLEPGRSLTGGAWYQDQDFESEFVEVLIQQSLKFLQMKRDKFKTCKDGPLTALKLTYCSVEEVLKYITDLKISKVQLDEDDLETILQTVVFDGNAERIPQVDGSFVYRAVDSPLPTTGLVHIPCGICPVIKYCSDCGDITAKTCHYLNLWLEL